MDNISEENECPDGLVGVCIQIEECPSIRSLLMDSVRPLPAHVVGVLQSHTCGFDNDKVSCKFSSCFLPHFICFFLKPVRSWVSCSK